MPTTLPRLNITLSHELNAVVRRLALASKQSNGAVVVGLLESIQPQMSDLAVLLETAAAAQGHLHSEFARTLERATEELAPMAEASAGVLAGIVQHIGEAVDQAKAAGTVAGGPQPITWGPHLAPMVQPADKTQETVTGSEHKGSARPVADAPRTPVQEGR